jgi:hypothetical protein
LLAKIFGEIFAKVLGNIAATENCVIQGKHWHLIVTDRDIIILSSALPRIGMNNELESPGAPPSHGTCQADASM